MTDLIGLCGFARVGKDTWAYEGLVQEYTDITFTRVALADELKADVASTVEALKDRVRSLDPNYDFDSPAWKERIRPIYVTYGTHVARAILDDIWLESAKPAIDDGLSKGTVVITDVRNANELEYVYSCGGYVVYLERMWHGPADMTERESIFAMLQKYPLLAERSVLNNENMDKAELARRVMRRVDQQKSGEYTIL